MRRSKAQRWKSRILKDGALDQYDFDEDEVITLNGYQYGYDGLGLGLALPMTFLLIFPDGSKPIVGDFTGNFHGAILAAINYF